MTWAALHVHPGPLPKGRDESQFDIPGSIESIFKLRDVLSIIDRLLLTERPAECLIYLYHPTGQQFASVRPSDRIGERIAICDNSAKEQSNPFHVNLIVS